MMKKLTCTVAAAALVTGFAMLETASAGCGSCGPAAVVAPKATDVTDASCKSECTRAEKKTCKSECKQGEAKTCKSECKPAEAKTCKSECKPAEAKTCKSGCKKTKASPVGCTTPSYTKKEKAEIQTHTLDAIVNSGAAVTVLDARSGKYDDGRRIPGAKSLSPSATAEQAAALIPSKDALVVTYCSGVKCPASNMLAETLKGFGYKNVVEYPVGISGWADHGNTIEQAK